MQPILLQLLKEPGILIIQMKQRNYCRQKGRNISMAKDALSDGDLGMMDS